MNISRMERLAEARKYQKMAICSLLPDNMKGHVDVIEKELKDMVKEGLFQLLQSEAGMEIVKSMMMSCKTSEETEEKSKEDKKGTKVKEVNIE